MLEKASINRRGAILLGKYVACDAFEESKPLRVVTHAHADHMVGLQQSLKKCEKVLMTKATKDLIDVLRGPLFLMGGSVETVDYGKPLHYGGERLTFFKADHILGAAQVLVEDEEGVRLVYTGDFRIDGTPVLEADVLVMEATYGVSACKRSFSEDVKSLLVSLVEVGLKDGRVYVFGYHGKLQEVMQILYEAGVRVPFVVPERVFHVSKVYEQHGVRLGRLTFLRDEKDIELFKGNSPCVVFHHMGSRGKVGEGFLRIYVSGWEFGSPCRMIADKEYVVALSDHSDFDGLMEYVRLSKPKFVVTDNFRIGYAEALAREINKRFRISAVALPKMKY
jgi:putative mRNA 3-end processing factor